MDSIMLTAEIEKKNPHNMSFHIFLHQMQINFTFHVDE